MQIIMEELSAAGLRVDEIAYNAAARACEVQY